MFGLIVILECGTLYAAMAFPGDPFKMLPNQRFFLGDLVRANLLMWGPMMYISRITGISIAFELGEVLFPPVLLMLLILEMKPIYFSHYSTWWYFGIIGLFEVGRLVPIVEGDIQLVYKKPFIESAMIAGGSQFWIFRKHVLRWLMPYIFEYVPSQYARILTVMGELGYFGVVTRALITTSQGGARFATHQLDLPTLLAMGGHHWFVVPGGVFFPTIILCLMIVCFRLIATGVSSATAIRRSEYWPWPDQIRKLLHINTSTTQKVSA